MAVSSDRRLKTKEILVSGIVMNPITYQIDKANVRSRMRSTILAQFSNLGWMLDRMQVKGMLNCKEKKERHLASRHERKSLNKVIGVSSFLYGFNLALSIVKKKQ
jgi:hypothetical protein